MHIALTSVLLLSSGHALAGKKQTSLTQAQIREVIRKGAARVSRCYAVHAMKQKGADGRVRLQLVIRASGKVGSAKVEAPSVRGKKFKRCVVKVAKRWRFPKAAGETEVIYPFYFLHTHARGAGPIRHRGRR